MQVIEEYDLYCEFDADKHKKKYVNYLEVMIDSDGKIMYAVPSHQEMAIKLACEKYNVTRTELDTMCPKEYYFDFMTWLLMQSEAVAVWNDFYIGNLNSKQRESLRMLKDKGIYSGNI